jgi:hypothetical protein
MFHKVKLKSNESNGGLTLKPVRREQKISEADDLAVSGKMLSF